MQNVVASFWGFLIYKYFNTYIRKLFDDRNRIKKEPRIHLGRRDTLEIPMKYWGKDKLGTCFIILMKFFRYSHVFCNTYLSLKSLFEKLLYHK